MSAQVIVPATPTQSEDAVERACRSVSDFMVHDGSQAFLPWDETSDEDKEYIRKMVCAALAATPTPPAPSRDAVEAMREALRQIAALQGGFHDQDRASAWKKAHAIAKAALAATQAPAEPTSASAGGRS